jgi:hypothetical protein
MGGSMIERVARALAKASIGFMNDKPRDFQAAVDRRWPLHVEMAKIAIEAMREPTAAMINAAKLAEHDQRWPDLKPTEHTWEVTGAATIAAHHRAMIDVALGDPIQTPSPNP